MITIYGISNCDTVRKTRNWLKDNNIAYQFHDFRKQALATSAVEHWLQQVGQDTLINKRGRTYRELSDANKQTLAGDGMVTLLIEQPTLMKRPIIDNDGEISVGFDAARLQKFL